MIMQIKTVAQRWRGALFAVLVIAAALTVFENIASIFQCPGRADESWYLYITRNNIQSPYSFFVSYFGFARDWGFCEFRTFSIALRILCGSFLGYAVYSFFKKTLDLMYRDAIVLSMCIPCLLGNSQTAGCPSYVMLNYAFGCTSFGFLLLSLRTNLSIRFRAASAFFCGLIAIQVAFVMPPNVVILPVLLLVLLLASGKTVCWFVLGTLTGIAAFFLFACRPSEFMAAVRIFQGLNYETTDGHSIMVLVRWLVSTASWSVPAVSIGLLLWLADGRVRGMPVRWRFFYWSILSVGALAHCGAVLGNGIYVYSLVRVDMLVMCVVLLALIFKRMEEGTAKFQEFLVISLFILAPVCYSFGTNIEFPHRGCRYMIFYLLPIWVLTRKYASNLGYCYLMFFGVSYLGLMVFHLLFTNGYNGVKLVQSTSSMREFGFNCMTTAKHVDELKRLREVASGRDIIIGGEDSWRPTVLLAKRPISTLWYAPNYVVKLLSACKPDKDNVFVLEQKNVFELTPEHDAEIMGVLGASHVSRTKISDTCTVVVFK